LSDAVEKFFGQRWLSPLEQIGPYAYDYSVYPHLLVICAVVLC